ncbi:ABC transporter permease [Candidatus Poribacteria bacterium]|nr:ABC transporter permease [Candidatus Poribacteria bacterium]
MPIVQKIEVHNDAETVNSPWRLLIESIRELWRYRELLAQWMLRDIKIRYKQTIFGAAWAVIQPFVLMVIFTFVFGKFARVSSDGLPYPIFSYVALVPWTLFSNSLHSGATALITNSDLVTKIYFPKEILVFASSLALLLDFGVASIIFVGLAFYFHIGFSWTVVWVPVLLMIQILLAWGIALILATLNVFYRDVKYALSLVIQVWMYITPIIYPLSQVPEKIRPFYMLNPIAVIINGYRQVVLHTQAPDATQLWVVMVVTVILFFVTYLNFKRLELQFADLI